MPDYRALLANCLMQGENFTVKGRHQTRNLIEVQINNFDIGLVEHLDIVNRMFSDFKGQAIHTTTLNVRNISESQFKDVDELAGEIAELLALATSSPVTKFGYGFGDNGCSGPIIGQTEYFRPAIDTKRGDLVRSFLERTWPEYHKLRHTRRLNLALNYYVLSQQGGQPMELLLVVSFVLLESLKHHFAQDAGYPYIKGFFRQAGATASNPGRSKSFKELLKEMFQKEGMTPNLAQIVELRNDLIHSGMSAKSPSAQTAIYYSCQDDIREYLLRLLDYTGEYYRFSTPNEVSIL